MTDGTKALDGEGRREKEGNLGKLRNDCEMDSLPIEMSEEGKK